MTTKFFDKYPEEKLIRWFKQVAVAEAITCFFLYFLAIPFKRYFPEELWSTIFIIIVGNIHGLFFVLYLVMCLPARKIYNWDDEDFVFALLASLFPFATVWVEKSLAKKDRTDH